MHEPSADERPVLLADRLGAAYAGGVGRARRKDHGLYLTPVAVAEFMAALGAAGGGSPVAGRVRVLDPAAGAGILLCAVLERLATAAAPPRRVELGACEVDPGLAEVLRAVLGHAAGWAGRRGIEVAVEVQVADFVTRHAGGPGAGGLYDVVIANPPYFKIAGADPRAALAAGVVHGQPNIYGLFMAVGAGLLREGGSLVYLTPRSFASGPYFRALRSRFFAEIRPLRVHVFASRREAFRRDEVLQENIILHGERRPGWTMAGSVTLSLSRGSGDLGDLGDLIRAPARTVPIGEVLAGEDGDRVLRLAATDEEAAIARLVASWPGSLRGYGLAISTGPVVPFRAVGLIGAEGDVPREHAPLLWMNHVTPMRVRWPLRGRKREYIRGDGRARLVPGRNMVLLRRFSAKEERRRLVAAPLLAGDLPGAVIGLENHLNYVHRPGGELAAAEAWGLAALYNSALLDTWFRTVSGSTQVNAAELRAMPLPEHGLVLELGRRVAGPADAGDLDAIDALVAELLLGRAKLDSRP